MDWLIIVDSFEQQPIQVPMLKYERISRKRKIQILPKVSPQQQAVVKRNPIE